MPGLKRSATRRVKYGGDRSAEMELREAIDFLFQLRGVEYQKLHPEFTIPTSEEFFTYARRANDDMVKTRVAPKSKTVRPAVTYIKRKLPTTVLRGGNRVFDNFLRFVILPIIVGPTPCDTLFLCFNVLLYAIMAYKLAKVFLREQLANPGLTRAQFITNIRTAIGDREYANSFADPVRWFCENIMPILNDRRDQLMSMISSVIARFSEFILGLLVKGDVGEFRATAASAVGMAVISALNLFYVSPLTFDSLVALPLACMLAGMGYAGCGEKCRAIMERLAGSFGMAPSAAGSS